MIGWPADALMRPALDTEITARGLRRRVALRGELDMDTAPEVERILEAVADRGNEVLLDLSGLTFMDSTGVRALLHGRNVCSERGCRFVLSRKMHVRVQELLSLTEVFDSLSVT